MQGSAPPSVVKMSRRYFTPRAPWLPFNTTPCAMVAGHVPLLHISRMVGKSDKTELSEICTTLNIPMESNRTITCKHYDHYVAVENVPRILDYLKWTSEDISVGMAQLEHVKTRHPRAPPVLKPKVVKTDINNGNNSNDNREDEDDDVIEINDDDDDTPVWAKAFAGTVDDILQRCLAMVGGPKAQEQYRETKTWMREMQDAKEEAVKKRVDEEMTRCRPIIEQRLRKKVAQDLRIEITKELDATMKMEDACCMTDSLRSTKKAKTTPPSSPELSVAVTAAPTKRTEDLVNKMFGECTE